MIIESSQGYLDKLKLCEVNKLEDFTDSNKMGKLFDLINDDIASITGFDDAIRIRFELDEFSDRIRRTEFNSNYPEVTNWLSKVFLEFKVSLKRHI